MSLPTNFFIGRGLKKSPVLGYSVGQGSSNGTNGIMLFDPATMERLALFHTGSAQGAQNVVMDELAVYHNYGYNNNDISRYLKSNLNPTASGYVNSATFNAGDQSRSNIAVDATKIYNGRNDGRVRFQNKLNGSGSLDKYIGNSSEMYALAVDNTYAYVGGSANNGDMKIYQRSNFNNYSQISASNYSTISSIVTDDSAIYFTGYGSGLNGLSVYKAAKSNHGSLSFNSYIPPGGSGSSYTNAVVVDDSYVYTSGYSTNYVGKFNKSTLLGNSGCVISSTSIPRFGTSNISLTVEHGKGLISDTDSLYLAADTDQGPYVIKIDKATMSPVACLQHPSISNFNFWSGGRHITLDNQEGGGMFWYRNAISNWNVNENASNILV